MLRVRVRGDILVLLEHGILQPGVSADPLDQGAQAPVQAPHEEERQGLETPHHVTHQASIYAFNNTMSFLKCRALYNKQKCNHELHYKFSQLFLSIIFLITSFYNIIGCMR